MKLVNISFDLFICTLHNRPKKKKRGKNCCVISDNAPAQVGKPNQTTTKQTRHSILTRGNIIHNLWATLTTQAGPGPDPTHVLIENATRKPTKRRREKRSLLLGSRSSSPSFELNLSFSHIYLFDSILSIHKNKIKPEYTYYYCPLFRSAPVLILKAETIFFKNHNETRNFIIKIIN